MASISNYTLIVDVRISGHHRATIDVRDDSLPTETIEMLAALHIVTTCLCISAAREEMFVANGKLTRIHKNVRDSYSLVREPFVKDDVILHQLDTGSGLYNNLKYGIGVDGDYKIIRRLGYGDESFRLFIKDGSIHREDGPAFINYGGETWVKHNKHVKPPMLAKHDDESSGDESE